MPEPAPVTSAVRVAASPSPAMAPHRRHARKCSGNEVRVSGRHDSRLVWVRRQTDPRGCDPWHEPSPRRASIWESSPTTATRCSSSTETSWGLEFEATLVLEAIGIARMDRLRCNDSVLKLVTPTAEVPSGQGRRNRGMHGLAVCHAPRGRCHRGGGRLRGGRRAGRVAPATESSRSDDRNGGGPRRQLGGVHPRGLSPGPYPCLVRSLLQQHSSSSGPEALHG